MGLKMAFSGQLLSTGYGSGKIGETKKQAVWLAGKTGR
jgi:hypothetical protein